MSRGRRRFALVVGAAGVLGLLALWPLLADTTPARLEVQLVARDMAFHLDGHASSNPTIHVPVGADVRVTLQNQDAGMTHDFAVPELGVAIRLLKRGDAGFVTFRAPDRPGTYQYVCNPHAQMMAGTLRVE